MRKYDSLTKEELIKLLEKANSEKDKIEKLYITLQEIGLCTSKCMKFIYSTSYGFSKMKLNALMPISVC